MKRNKELARKTRSGKSPYARYGKRPYAYSADLRDWERQFVRRNEVEEHAIAQRRREASQ